MPPTTTMMSPPPFLFEGLDQLGHQGLVPGRQGGDPDDVHVVFDGHAGSLLRGLEHRADVHVEPQVGKAVAITLHAAVVAVLAHLGHQDPRPAALAFLELIGALAEVLMISLSPYSAA